MKEYLPSATVAMNALAAEKKRRGERIYNFAAGDPLLANHQSIILAATQKLKQKTTPYPPVEGLVELRTLVAKWMNSEYFTHYSKENVLVTCGGKFAIFATTFTLLQPGDEVLIIAPYWLSYPEIVKMAKGRARIIPTCSEKGWKITAKDLAKHATNRSKMLIFNNASNPTGILYTREEIAEILAEAKRLNLLVLSDEVYSGLVYDENCFISCGSFPEHQERVVVVQSCSKNFAMTGWRVGFVLASEQIIRQLAVLQSQSTTGVSVISQWGAIGALENAQEVNSYVKRAMQQRRDLFVTTFNDLFPLPISNIVSALYAFVPLSMLGARCSDANELCKQLISSYNIALVPGGPFGMQRYVRFAFSEEQETIFLGLHQLKQAMEKL